MRQRFLDYNCGHRIVSIAHDPETKADLTEDRLHFIYTAEGKPVLYPDQTNLHINQDLSYELAYSHNYDVLEIWENGEIQWQYKDTWSDNTFFLTGKCNSNCIMCPVPEFVRKNVENTNIRDLIETARHMPTSIRHITVTGGEPFMVGEEIFILLDFLRNKFNETEFLILTNGRIFALDKYVQLACRSMPVNTVFGIPIHGASPTIHDAITRSKGSYDQTITGIKKLLAVGIPIELRFVVTKINIGEFSGIADLIIREIPQIHHICVMAPEMTGNAYINRNDVWISYSSAFEEISSSVAYLINNGIDVKIYNFPLCTIGKEFRMLCARSISAEKIRYADCCVICKYKDSCGGVFAGTLNLEKDDLRPIS